MVLTEACSAPPPRLGQATQSHSASLGGLSGSPLGSSARSACREGGMREHTPRASRALNTLLWSTLLTTGGQKNQLPPGSQLLLTPLALPGHCRPVPGSEGHGGGPGAAEGGL